MRFGSVKLVLSTLLLGVAVNMRAQESGLQLMNNKERIDYFKSHPLIPPRVTVRDSAGQVLKNFNLRFPVIKGELYSGHDYYMNTAGKVVEVVVRKAGPEDYELNRRLFDLEEDLLRGSMEPVKLNCSQEREILAQVLATEQENRKKEQVIDAELDNVQESKVVSLLQQCPAPTVQTVGPEGIRAIYQVLLHARRKNQEKYDYVIQDFIKKGYLKKSITVSIEDRLLMAQVKKQRYGTQIVFFVKTGYFLYPCEDREHLDERRAAAGLPTIDAYLREREEFYGAEIIP